MLTCQRSASRRICFLNEEMSKMWKVVTVGPAISISCLAIKQISQHGYCERHTRFAENWCEGDDTKGDSKESGKPCDAGC